LFDLKREQKDVGKLKQNNEKLKEEMASLRAMLAAQAKQGAADSAHAKELAEKEKHIAELEKRIAQIEKELEDAKAQVEKLELETKKYHEESLLDKETIRGLQSRRPGVIHTRIPSLDAPPSPESRRTRNISGDVGTGTLPILPSNYVSPEELAKHRSKVATLEEELEAERRFRRQADGEIIKLRAKVNGVDLNDDDVNDLLAQRLDTPRSEMVSEESSFADESASKFRYIIFIFALLLFELLCVAMLLRRRAFLRACLRLLAAKDFEPLNDEFDNNTNHWSEFYFDRDIYIDHHRVDYLYLHSS
jgi:chromosome segregation ATPase